MAFSNFYLWHVRTKKRYDIIDDGRLGGFYYEHSSVETNSIFRVVLSNYNNELMEYNPFLAKYQFNIRTRDIIQLYYYDGTKVFDGVITRISVPIPTNEEKYVTFSGVSFFDFWTNSRIMERDYTEQGKKRAVDILQEAFSISNPFFYVNPGQLPFINNNPVIEQQYLKTTARDVIKDVCSIANLEVYVDLNRHVQIFDVGNRDWYKKIVDEMIVDDSRLEYDSEDSEYEEIYLSNQEPIIKPSNQSYTFLPQYWHVTDPSSMVVEEPTIEGDVITSPVIKARNTRGNYLEVHLIPESLAEVPESSLGIIEKNWNRLNYRINIDQAGIKSFKVRFHDIQRGWWESIEKLDSLKQDQGGGEKVFIADQWIEVSDLLPSTHARAEQKQGYTVVGDPENIDYVSFIFRSDNLHMGVKFADVFFETFFAQKAFNLRGETFALFPPRQKILVDPVRVNFDVIEARLASAASNLRLAAVQGHVVIDGNIEWDMAIGQGIAIDLKYAAIKEFGDPDPRDIPRGTTTTGNFSHRIRLHRVRQASFNGEWKTTLSFAPAQVSTLVYLPPY